MEDYILRAVNLNKSYNKKCVLKNLNMNIKRGDIYGLIGKNGVGKTTLMRLITGLANVRSGDIEIFNADNDKALTRERKRIGALIEMPAFYGDMTFYTLQDEGQIDADNLFDKFYKADKARKVNSTGLGLSIVKELMGKMNGTVEADIVNNSLHIMCRWELS